MKTQLQSEAAECGLACLATVGRLLGHGDDLVSLRRRFPPSARGTDLSQLMEIASAMGLCPRPARAELDDLGDLRLPCILHWKLDHFVVLRKVRRGRFLVADPAVGDRVLSRAEMSAGFTGVALELTPTSDFQVEPPAPRFAWRKLLRQAHGLPLAMTRIFIVAVVLEGFAVLAPLLQQLVIDDVLVSGDAELLTVLILGFTLMLLLQSALGLARSWMVIVLGQSLSLQWTTNVFARLIRLPLDFFERRHLGDIASKFDSTTAVQRVLTQGAVEALLDGLMAAVALGLMVGYSLPLTGVVMAAVAIYALLRRVTYGAYRDAAAERLVVAARESGYFLETLRAMTPLKLFGRESQRQGRWQNLVVDVQNRDLRTARLNTGFGIASTLIFGLENLLVLWLGARLILAQGRADATPFTIGMLFAFIAYKTQFTSRASALIGFIVDWKAMSVHTERLADIVLAPSDADDVPPTDLAHLPPRIELRRVSFRYSESDPWILKDVSLSIEAGRHVALTGASGSGKSTLLKIALGLLAPTEGEVLYGGVPIRRLGVANVRRCIGTVMQADALLSGSIAENICFFESAPSLPDIEAAARAARLHEDIVRMPMAYASLIGDLGAGLSGGQRQRLLLARCLYKRPRVIALDEATSELDLANERAIATALRRMRVTRITIAHRPETVAGADRAIELRSGALHERHAPRVGLPPRPPTLTPA
ncbi:hypothetical protein CDN99_10040 [Roseateles aquatilis]|uniref:ABC transporter n=1 Tax=Roseateles aquatilis TaxID=431061 RepID=A0A246JFV5_9BURK|nr:peptidase domain-containing ABC transporter [Roseateles aquatilis]OWQ91482.1 hypothetical protein CDN99_10040 [Roseateles aquatilis]